MWQSASLAPLKRWFGTEGSHTSQQESPGVPHLDYGGVMLAKQRWLLGGLRPHWNMCCKAAGVELQVWRCGVVQSANRHLRGKDGWQLGGLRTSPAAGPAYSFQRWQLQYLSPAPPHPTTTTTTFFLPSDFDTPPNKDKCLCPLPVNQGRPGLQWK